MYACLCLCVQCHLVCICYAYQITGIGDVLLLNGDLGAGKTCFSRGVVRGMHNDEGMIVTSPTYLLDK